MELNITKNICGIDFFVALLQSLEFIITSDPGRRCACPGLLCYAPAALGSCYIYRSSSCARMLAQEQAIMLCVHSVLLHLRSLTQPYARSLALVSFGWATMLRACGAWIVRYLQIQLLCSHARTRTSQAASLRLLAMGFPKGGTAILPFGCWREFTSRQH